MYACGGGKGVKWLVVGWMWGVWQGGVGRGVGGIRWHVTYLIEVNVDQLCNCMPHMGNQRAPKHAFGLHFIPYAVHLFSNMAPTHTTLVNHGVP